MMAPALLLPFNAVRRAMVFVFFKIKEPRTIRIIQLGIYICLIFAGHFVVTNPPPIYTDILGGTLTFAFGGAIMLGAILGAIAVLPGVWWLERLALILLWAGLLTFVTIALALGISLVGMLIAVALGLSLWQRWTDITEYDLAPRSS